MATATLISAAEYLTSTYRPDCDYLDGQVVERNVGEQSHGRLQGLIFAWLLAREQRWKIRAMVEVRLRINSQRFRIPDVMVLSASVPREEAIVVTPPLLCIEILSPGDNLKRIWDRTQDYFSIGVPTCWIIDPQALSTPQAWIATTAALTEAKDGMLRAGEIELLLSEVTQQL